MSALTLAGLAMFLIPVLWCLWQIFGPLFKTFERREWLIFGGVIAWYGVASFLVGSQS